MHAKVLLTMGLPVAKGGGIFCCYNKAKEVYNSGSFYLFDNYNQLRSVENSGEIIFASA